MKYSELKEKVKLLHSTGWEKDLFFEGYFKCWRNGNMGCRQIISNTQVIYSISLESIIEHCENQAKIILNQVETSEKCQC